MNTPATKSKVVDKRKLIHLRQVKSTYHVWCVVAGKVLWWARTNDSAVAEFIYNFED